MVHDSREINLTPLELATQIEQFIRVRTGGTIYGLKVDVRDDDVVVLSGRTSTYYNKQLATHAAQSALQEQRLNNDIEVC